MSEQQQTSEEQQKLLDQMSPETRAKAEEMIRMLDKSSALMKIKMATYVAVGVALRADQHPLETRLDLVRHALDTMSFAYCEELCCAHASMIADALGNGDDDEKMRVVRAALLGRRLIAHSAEFCESKMRSAELLFNVILLFRPEKKEQQAGAVSAES